MALTFDATVSGETATSYVTVEYADSFFNLRLNSDSWDELTTTEKQAALVQATRRIDNEYFQGDKKSRLQSLQWPRNFIFDKNGYPRDSSVIPSEIEHAVCEMAFYLVDEDNREVSDSMMTDMKRVKIGPLEYEFRDSRTGDKLPPVVTNLLKAIGPGVWRSAQVPSFARR